MYLNPITFALDMSNGSLQSIKNPSTNVINATNMLLHMSKQYIDPVEIVSLNLSRCKLVDEDIVLISDIAIQQLTNLEHINLSQNWFGASKNALKIAKTIKALRHMAKWGITVDISNTELAKPEYLKLFKNAATTAATTATAAEGIIVYTTPKCT